MSALPQHERLTEAEYLQLERESDIKHEYINGVVYAMSGGSETHIRISGNTFAALHSALRGGDCSAYTADMRVRAASTFAYPDVSVVCGEAQFIPGESIATLMNPVLLVGVLSPSTEAFDRGRKFNAYRQLDSLRDYLLIAQDVMRVELFSRTDEDKWLLTVVERGSVLLPSLNMSLGLADVYERVAIGPDSTI